MSELPPVNERGDLRIRTALHEIRRKAEFEGWRPNFRRGVMYWDFDANKVRVRAVNDNGGRAA